MNIFDQKRSQNMCIMLARLPLTFAEIRAAVLDMDGVKIDEDMAQAFLDFLPTQEEVCAVVCV